MNRTILLLAALWLAACTTSPATVPDGGDTAEVLRVLDGDSLLVDVNGTETEVRLLGINAPERDECFADEAAMLLRELSGNRVRLVGTETDRFGRLLGYAYTAADLSVGHELVSRGAAIALSIDHPERNRFKAAEQEAFTARRGRWEPEVCGPAADGSEAVVIAGVLEDAPGDDAANANGEWIEVANQRGEGVSLGGWSIQDESSSHRFAFPPGFELNQTVRVFSGCGDATADSLYWCDDDPVWNNGGDTAYLLDPSGNVVDRFAF
ncbi:MAG: hypothetical protein HKN74_05235 [Acidimicrobiia bacterium]|nr:lamin tail domain-containing protein [Acidimicrobiia bacterium]NNF09671.1 hypothetical protein [Acidimicrobiia bacterium]NNL68768.1 hypothetical protein [Acidimicrobiia bacterium]